MNALKLTSAGVFLLTLISCSSNKVKIEETAAPAVTKAATVTPTPPTWGHVETGNFVCELGNQVGIKEDDEKTKSLIMLWKGRSYKLQPVSTTTGAFRFESKEDGMVWIQIPNKAMLLNFKAGHQLANDCKVRSK